MILDKDKEKHPHNSFAESTIYSSITERIFNLRIDVWDKNLAKDEKLDSILRDLLNNFHSQFKETLIKEKLINAHDA